MLGIWDLFERDILAASKEKGPKNAPFWPNFGGRTDRQSPPVERPRKKNTTEGGLRPPLINTQTRGPPILETHDI